MRKRQRPPAMQSYPDQPAVLSWMRSRRTGCGWKPTWTGRNIRRGRARVNANTPARPGQSGTHPPGTPHDCEPRPIRGSDIDRCCLTLSDLRMWRLGISTSGLGRGSVEVRHDPGGEPRVESPLRRLGRCTAWSPNGGWAGMNSRGARGVWLGRHQAATGCLRRVSVRRSCFHVVVV